MKNKNSAKQPKQRAVPKSMKTVGVLLMAGCMHLSATTYSQSVKLNLNLKNATLSELFEAIEQQSEFSILLKSNEVNLNQKISVDASNETVEAVLGKLLSARNLRYEVKDKHIIIVPAALGVSQKSQKVKGSIVDQTGEPIIGATIIEEGTTNGTTTDFDGLFEMEISSGGTLKISYIGYVTKAVKPGNQKDLKIVLLEDTKQLEEVVVVGYGTNTKRTLISSVSTVDAKQMQNIPSTNITQSLAGRAPGLIVQGQGGGVNKKSTISIRGGSTPLVVIDGVIRAYDDFVNLAPEDIENFSILKDASATAVYGSRAANGILQVTTRKGKEGSKPQIEYSFNQSFAQPNILPKKLDSYNRAFYMNQAAKNDGLTLPFTDEDLRLYQDGSDPFGHANVDWQEVVLRDFAPQQKHNIRMSGGSEINKFYVSLGYVDQGSLYRSGTHNMDRTNFRLNQSTLIKSIGLRVTSQIDGYVEKTDHPFTSTSDRYFHIFSHIQNKKPWELAYNKHGLPYTLSDNPVSETSADAGYDKQNKNVVNGMLALDWETPWVKELHLKGTASYRYYGNERKRWRKDPAQYQWDSQDPQYGALSQLTKDMSNGYSYTLQFLADYNKSFGKHNLSALVGYEATYGFSSSIWGSRDSYQFDIDQINAGPDASMKNGGSESEAGRAGFVGQVKYNYDNRYLVEGSMRYDGSDNFPKHKRWGAFFSGSLGWSIADEAFFETIKEKNIFNTLKLRGSYGEVGLDNWGEEGDPYWIGRFAYLPSYALNSQSYVIGNMLQPGFSEGAIPSPDISWFTTKQVDFGVDFSSLNSQLYGSIDYFYYQTSGFLYQPDQLETGYVDPLGLALPRISTDGEHRRAGWEFQLGYRNNIGELEYDISGNFTIFDQLWARNPNESLDAKKNPYKRTTQQKGYWGVGYESMGYYIDSYDIYNSVKRLNSTNLASGDIKYYDFNGDGVLDGQDQIRIGKNGFPRGNYGVNLGLRYKGFSLSVLFQGATRFDMELGSTVKMNDSQTGSTPVYGFQTDYWTENNKDAKFPRLLSSGSVNGNNNTVTSDFWLINGAYFRLKDIQLSYDFKRILLRDVNWITSLNLVLSGQNIFTISEATKYGMDPENASTNNYAYPMERMYGFGINVGF